ncbi:MAG: thioredoxin family protein [Candidatus Acidiferrales bacterium]|jgi:ketosteroid isomerase-like protein
MHHFQGLILASLGALMFCVAASAALPRPQAGADTFAPLEQWRQAVLAGDAARLASFYSTAPAAQITSPENKSASAADEVAFWKQWKQQGLVGVSIEIAQQQEVAPGMRQLLLEIELTLQSAGSTRKLYVAVKQGWAQGQDGWRIFQVQRGAPARLRQPLSKSKVIYPVGVDAKAEIAEAIERAGKTHKRVLLVFGGNWCYDCHVLDAAFHSPEIAPLLEKSFEVVHVDIGEMNKNLDLTKQYDVPLARGVPAIAVLDGAGNLLFSQKHGEFEAARSLAPEDILKFLNTWKPAAGKN